MIQHIHFVGIKGVGMTALAVIAKEAGLIVTGSDTDEQFITDVTLADAGIIPFNGFSAEHVNEAQLVVTTGAHHGFDNPEVVSAKEKGIRVVSMAEATGMFINGQILGRKLRGISVSGTHGKTTTTAMIATILKSAGKDPSYLVGTSFIPSLGFSGHYGQGDYFVAEADEYATEPVHDRRPKFVWHHPEIAVITNIEHDHPDIYPDLASVKRVFSDFLFSLPAGSAAVINGDDPDIKDVLQEYSGRKISFGHGEANDAVITDISIDAKITKFSAKAFGKDLGEFFLSVPGEHNCLNALAAVLVCLETGLSLEQIKKGLIVYTGSKRRMEYKGTLESGALLYDDYGHHPTEIHKTLAALRAMYPDKKIISIFQPHTFSRTKALLRDFAQSFSVADTAIFMDIFASAREEPDPTVSSELLTREAALFHPNARFLPRQENVLKYLNGLEPGADTVIITIGAGDVYKIADKLNVINYKL